MYLKDTQALTTNLEEKASSKRRCVCVCVCGCAYLCVVLHGSASLLTITHADSVTHTHSDINTHKEYLDTKTLSVVSHVCLCFYMAIHGFLRCHMFHLKSHPTTTLF